MQIQLRPSRYLFFILSILHFGALIVILTITINVWFKVVFFAAIFSSFVFNIKKYAMLRHQHSVIKLISVPEGNWQLIRRNGQQMQAKLAGDSLRTTLVIILNFKIIEGKPKHISVPIFFDSISKETFRVLSVNLLKYKNR